MDLRRHLEEQGILDAEGRPDIELPAQGQLDLLELGQSGLGLLQMDLGQGDVMELGREQMEAAEKDAAVQGQMEEGQGDRTQQTVVSGTDAMTTMRLEEWVWRDTGICTVNTVNYADGFVVLSFFLCGVMWCKNCIYLYLSRLLHWQ